MSRLWQTLKQERGENTPYPEHNPLSETGKKVYAAMHKHYGKKGKNVFYATMNKKGMRNKWER